MSIAQEPLPAKRILVMRYRFIGDTILTVPFLRNLRRAYPDATIDVLVGPQSGTVLDGCPYLDNFIIFDTTRFHKYDSGQGKTRNFLSYAFELRKNKYDLVFVLKRSLSAAILALLTGAKYRVGYATQGRSLLLTHPVKWDKSIHEVDSTLNVLGAAGVPIIDRHLESWTSPQEMQSLEDLCPQVKENRTKILFHAAAAHPDKVYPLEHWASIISKLCQEFDAQPFFTGASQDKELYEQLSQMSGVTGINLAGQLSLRQSMALYSKMNLAVCTDSGPAHLAAASQVPTLAIFGPTDPERWRPYGETSRAIYDSSLSCRPCNYRKICDDRPCLTKLAPETIILECKSMLSSTSKPAQTVN